MDSLLMRHSSSFLLLGTLVSITDIVNFEKQVSSPWHGGFVQSMQRHYDNLLEYGHRAKAQLQFNKYIHTYMFTFAGTSKQESLI
jgi:predicted glycosyltransferase